VQQFPLPDVAPNMAAINPIRDPSVLLDVIASWTRRSPQYALAKIAMCVAGSPE